MPRRRAETPGVVAWGTANDIEANRGLVVRIAQRVSYHTLPVLEFDDLVSVGLVALAKALATWDATQGTLASYAWFKVYGAMQDELRRVDTRPRSVIWKQNAVKAARARVWTRTRAAVRSTDVAAELGISVRELDQWATAWDVYLSERDAESMTAVFHETLDTVTEGAGHAARVRLVAAALQTLRLRARRIVLCRFWRDESVDEIAERYRMTRRGVRDSLARSLRRLKGELRKRGVTEAGTIRRRA